MSTRTHTWYIQVLRSPNLLKKTRKLKMQSFLNIITLYTYTFFTMLMPRLHGHSKRFFRGSLWPLENRCCKSGMTWKYVNTKSVLQCWKQPKIAWCDVRWVQSVRNNFKVVVDEKLVNPSRPMRRSVFVMKEHSCSLLGPFFTQCWKKLCS